MQRPLFSNLIARAGAHQPCWSALAARPTLSQFQISRFRCLHQSPAPTAEHTYDRPSRIIFSGIQPTGVPHIGNYLGALRKWVELQNQASEDTRLIFCLVDLHAITLQQKPQDLRRWKRESLATLLAIGLDPEKCIIFHQSEVPAHTELMWILSCVASTGMLGRMTQWKDKISKTPKGKLDQVTKLGLFSYPVLQAADILAHGTTHVPVGEDQIQHLELTRNVATSFNYLYGNLFKIPEIILSPAKRIMSLTSPSLKMSKSHDNDKSRIVLSDTPKMIREKIMGALSDSKSYISYDPEKRPGLANLIELYGHMVDRRDYADIAEELQNKETSIKQLKEMLCDVVISHLEPYRLEYEKLQNDKKFLSVVTELGRLKAQASAEETLTKVKEAMGLSPIVAPLVISEKSSE